MKRYYYLITFSILFIVITVYLLLFSSKSYDLPEIDNVRTLDTELLIEIFQKKFDYVKDNSSFISPLNYTQFNMLKSVDIKDLNQLATTFLLMPNREIGYYPIVPLKPPVNQTLCMQLGQGSLGWYWIYGMDYEKKTSFMFYIVRNDLFNNDQLNKLGMKLGEGTIYYLSCGYCTGDNDWKTTPFTVIPANFTCKDDMTLLENGDSFRFYASKSGKISIKYSQGDIDFETQLTAREDPQFNGDNGCVPCYAGLGTNYWSYHNVEVTSLSLDGENIRFKSVDMTNGWTDRQWVKSRTRQPFLQIFKNVFSNQKTALPKYVWINLHLDDKQYILYFFPDDNYKRGDNLSCLVKIFSKDKKRVETKCNIKWLETSVIQNIDYPIKFEITNINNKTYILDGSYYGNGKCATIDNTNNLHYSGCAIITDESGKKIGDGFIEANQFQEMREYTKNSLSIIGLEDRVDEFINSGTGVRRYLPLLILLVWLATLALVSIYTIKIIKNKK
mgnify:FL=1